MAMIKCRNCGRNISDTEKVCPYCEEKIEKKMNCPKCESEDLDFSLLGKTSIFECKNCRYKFTVSQTGEIRDYIGAKVENFNVFTAFISMYKKMFNFRGRSRRKEYWLSLPLTYVVFGVLYALPTIASLLGSDLLAFLSILVMLGVGLVTAIALLALEIRRLHDTGRQWYSIFVTYVPLVGQLILLYYMIEDSEFGPNEYGPNPKGME